MLETPHLPPFSIPLFKKTAHLVLIFFSAYLWFVVLRKVAKSVVVKAKMANRAVVGAVAATAGLYMAHERYQDHLAKKEEAERAQRQEDFLENVARRAAEEEAERQYREATGAGRGRGRRRNTKGQSSSGGGFQNTRAFKSIALASAIDGLLKEMLVDMVEQVKAEAAARNRSRGILDDGKLHLPLLDTDRNSPDEIALAAALAFGSQSLVDSVIRAEIVQPGPGTALARLTSDSMHLLVKILETCKREIRKESPIIGKDSLNTLIYCTVLDTERDSNHGMRLLGKVNLPVRGAKDELRGLQECASSVGLHAIPMSAWRRQKGPTWKTMDFIYDPYFNYYSAHGAGGEEVWITNFTGSFTVPAGETREEWDGQISVQYDMMRLQPLRTGRRKNKGGSSNATPRQLTDDDLDAVYDIGAKVLASKAVEGALHELLRLWKENDGEPVSLEHIASRSGYDGNLLTGLRKNTAEVLSERSDYLFNTLSDQLLSCVPPPGRSWNDYWQLRDASAEIDDAVCGYSNEESAAKAYRVHEREVATFVRTYNRLVDLSYCLVPVCGMLRPSDCVPSASVYCRAMDILFETDFPSQSLVRSLVFDERERLLKARELSAPSAFLSSFCIFTLVSTLFWLSYEGIVRAPFVSASNTSLAFPLAGFLALTCLSPTLGFLDGPLRVKHQTDSDMVQRIWTTATYLTERLCRALSVWRGLGTPFEREVRDLTKMCVDQQQIWLHRCCERDFYKALHRKRIDSAELELLLMAMVTKKATNHMEGTLPGSIDEANAFLDIKVEDNSREENASIGDSVRDAFLSIGDAMKNNLLRKVLISKSSLLDPIDEEEARGDIGQELVLHDGNALSGVAILCSGDITLVRLDKINALLPVPTKLCSFVNIASTMESAGSEIDDGDESDSDTEEVFNQDDAMQALERARRRRAQEKLERKKPGAKKVKVKTRKSTKSEPPSPSDHRGDSDKSQPEDYNSSTTPSRHQTVREALKAGGWKLIRMKNHLVYRRKIKPENGVAKESHQTVTMAKTPSDWRAKRNILSNLRRLDEEARVGVRNSPSEGDVPIMSKQCAECHENKGSEDFSKNQLKRENPKCKQCVVTTHEQEMKKYQ